MARRPIWLINMGDGTWAVYCKACRLSLYRGPKAGADRAARGHYCEPVLPLAAPVGGASPDPAWTDAPPTANPSEGATS